MESQAPSLFVIVFRGRVRSGSPQRFKLGCMLLFRVPFFFATKVTGTQEVTEFCSNSFPVDRKKEQLGLAGLDQKESKKEPKRKVITLILTLSQP